MGLVALFSEDCAPSLSYYTGPSKYNLCDPLINEFSDLDSVQNLERCNVLIRIQRNFEMHHQQLRVER